jgi:hypothetical protein
MFVLGMPRTKDSRKEEMGTSGVDQQFKELGALSGNRKQVGRDPGGMRCQNCREPGFVRYCVCWE